MKAVDFLFLGLAVFMSNIIFLGNNSYICKAAGNSIINESHLTRDFNNSNPATICRQGMEFENNYLLNGRCIFGDTPLFFLQYCSGVF